MKIDLYKTVSEDDLGNIVKENRPDWFGSTKRLRFYKGHAHGINEIVRGLVGMFPHKKQVAYVKGMSPYLSGVLPYFAKEGIKVRELTLADIAQSATIAEELKKDSLIVLMAEDDPATGRLFPIDAFCAELTKAKVFSLVLNHNQFLFQPAMLEMASYTAKLLAIGPEMTVGLLGSRTKTEPLICGDLFWAETSAADLKNTISNSKSAQVAQKKVVEFEGTRPAGSKILFGDFFDISTPRIFDRACLAWTDLNGDALVSLASSELPEPLATLSSCHWNIWRLDTWLKDQGLSEEVIRGLVLIPADLISNDTIKVLERVVQKIRHLQTGN